MNHDDVKNALPAYHDHELAPDQVKRVEHHLKSCPDCRGELAELKRLSAMVAPLIGIEDTEQFVQRVIARLPELTPSFWEQILAWWKIPALAMSALLLISVAAQRTDSAPSTSSLLCSDANSAAVKHLCSDDTAHSDELMNLVWGES